MLKRIRRLLRRFLRDTRGVVAVEFAILIVPTCLLILAGLDLVQLADARKGATALATNACSYGARSASVQLEGNNGFMLDIPTAQSKALEVFNAAKADAFMARTLTTATIEVEPLTEASGYIQCTVTVTVAPLIGFLSSATKTIVVTMVD